jgi:hypothetical protein
MRTTSVLCLLLLGGCAAANETLPRTGVLRARTVPHASGNTAPVAFKVNARHLGLGAGGPCETDDRMAVVTAKPGEVTPMPRVTSPGTSVPIPNACAVTHGAPGLKGSVPGVPGTVQPVPGPKGGGPGVLRPSEPVQAPPKELQP